MTLNVYLYDWIDWLIGNTFEMINLNGKNFLQTISNKIYIYETENAKVKAKKNKKLIGIGYEPMSKKPGQSVNVIT